jgi:hypothetical protein
MPSDIYGVIFPRFALQGPGAFLFTFGLFLAIGRNRQDREIASGV